jgi:FGGY-family pentulose kinase
VDVGSGSVRAGLFNTSGELKAQAEHPIQQFMPRADYVEQSSDDIWLQVCRCVREVVTRAAVAPESVVGLGFDATCSLVALDADGRPSSVSPDGRDEQNIVMWMDHRAIAEARAINATGHEALRYVGGEVSPEMELPKLLWLKRHRPEQFERAGLFLDLADFLVYRAIEQPVRSLCTLGCKWNYLAHEQRWPRDLLETLGLAGLLAGDRVAGAIQAPGSFAGALSRQAASELGLTTATVVATGIIDAHAGALGVLGDDPEGSVAMIAGTSACHIAVSEDPCFVPGVWGPYWGAVFPDGWINEGGQSAFGALIDHVVRDSAAYGPLRDEAQAQGTSVYALLNDRVRALEASEAYPSRELHVLDYHHGNRSPRADPSLKGMMTGLTLGEDRDALARRYLATLQAVSYGTRHIIEAMNESGHAIRTIRLCGGLTSNDLWLRELADATGLNLEVPDQDEPVLLGAAMLGATASGDFTSLRAAAAALVGAGKTIAPRSEQADFHAAKYRVYKQLYEHQTAYRDVMAAFD